MQIVTRLTITVAFLVLLLILCPLADPSQAGLTSPRLLINPYADVDWDMWGQHKANLHTHTSQGGAALSPAAVIDAYYQRGYTILALTDHDNRGSSQTTWPWQDYGRDPAELGMVAIQGNELSWQHHIGSYFNDYSGSIRGNVGTSLREIGKRGGLAVFFHPGRYNDPGDWHWYKPYFADHSHLLGIEVFNQGDRYPGDRDLWDNLLSHFMPLRPIWGFSNDDMHKPDQLGKNWNTLLLEELNEDAVREALVTGRFYATYQPGSAPAPIITSITADDSSITIAAQNHTSIRWISLGREIHRGKTLAYRNTPGIGVYVRAEIWGDGGVALLNPFGFVCEASLSN